MTPGRVSRLTVRDVMHPGIVSCPGDTGAAEVARLMAAHAVHCVAVVRPTRDGSSTARVWGIVSDLDVLSAVGRPGPPATAAELASEPVITVRPTLELEEAVQAMVRHGAHHVVVADPEGHAPVGVLSTLDAVAALGGWPRPAPRAGPAGRAASAAGDTTAPAASRARKERTARIRSMLRDRGSRNP